MIACQRLLLDFIDAERHGWQLIVEYCLLLVGCATDAARLWRNLLWLIQRVLVVHRTTPAQCQGLGGATALDTLQVQCDRLSLLRGVHNLDDNLACGLVEDT